MNDINRPVQSLKTLVISTVSAVLLAFFILLAFVGPAEYGIDPTGIGKALGLMVLVVPEERKIKGVTSCPAGEQVAQWQDIVLISLPANSGLEYKFYLDKGADITYEWSSDGAALYFDFHGEPEGNTTGYFKSYQESTDIKSNGMLTVPFTGIHGWYWKNDSATAVNITLKTKGKYIVKGLI